MYIDIINKKNKPGPGGSGSIVFLEEYFADLSYIEGYDNLNVFLREQTGGSCRKTKPTT
jgi:hypothetical protein